MINFNAEIGGYNFEFKTMNIREWKLFQVYVSVNGVKRRFHMAGNEDGFKITDGFPEVKDLEQDLSNAILQHKKEMI